MCWNTLFCKGFSGYVHLPPVFWGLLGVGLKKGEWIHSPFFLAIFTIKLGKNSIFDKNMDHRMGGGHIYIYIYIYMCVCVFLWHVSVCTCTSTHLLLWQAKLESRDKQWQSMMDQYGMVGNMIINTGGPASSQREHANLKNILERVLSTLEHC